MTPNKAQTKHSLRLFSLTILLSAFLLQCKKETKIVPLHKTKSSENLTTNFKDYYSSGLLKTEGYLLNNKKTGKWVSYYENGEVKSVRNFKDGKPDGYQKLDYSQVLYMEGYSRNGLKIGVWKSYFKDTNQLKYLKHFDNHGNKIGEWKSYYETGELYLTETFFNNQANGKETTYFKNGNVYTTGLKQDGQKVGTWKTFNEDGQLRNTEVYDSKN
ncbi:toxin-antitoxin system YwqK family antitoxin [Bizionia sp. KMM 8389]